MNIIGNEFIQIVNIDSRFIAVKGIGKLYYQEGFPIPMAVTELHKHGIGVSLLHIADELLKENWKPDKVYQRLKAELSDTIAGDEIINWDWTMLKKFVYLGYEEQRELLFDYLYETKEKGVEELRQYFKAVSDETVL